MCYVACAHAACVGKVPLVLQVMHMEPRRVLGVVWKADPGTVT